MPCSCVELEIQHGQGQCKCVHYRDHFPDCACEQGSVSEHSPKPVGDDEVLVRTLFQDHMVDDEGRLKPIYFRQDPESRGFSVDRMRVVDPQSFVAKKKADHRFNGYLGFMVARGRDIRALLSGDGTRLFCLYDTATSENEAHADICQNLVHERGIPDRKSLMKKLTRRLHYAFGPVLSLPPDQSTSP